MDWRGHHAELLLVSDTKHVLQLVGVTLSGLMSVNLESAHQHQICFRGACSYDFKLRSALVAAATSATASTSLTRRAPGAKVP